MLLFRIFAIMGTLDDSNAIFRYHRQMAAEHGDNSSLALGWRNFNDQQLRFDILTSIADLNGKTVLDAGCGYADLFGYLQGRFILAHYYGVEQIPELFEKAAKRYGDLENVTLISRNFLGKGLPVVDYVMASGSLNYANSDPGFIFDAVTALFEHCRHGMAFNLLSSVSQNGLLVAYPPALVITHCQTLAKQVELKQGYANDDYTVYLYRNQY